MKKARLSKIEPLLERLEKLSDVVLEELETDEGDTSELQELETTHDHLADATIHMYRWIKSKKV